MVQDGWLTSHPYLEPVARLHAEVARAAGALVRTPSMPIWDTYLADFNSGVPLLLSKSAVTDFESVERTVVTLIERLASDSLAGTMLGEIKELNAELHLDSSAPCRAVAWLLGKDAFTSRCPGLLRYLGWTVLARHIGPIVNAFAIWRDESKWLRNYCPTCGSLPAMAQLVGTDPGRRRFLFCGQCGSCWHYQRTGCPFCNNTDDHRLAVLAIEGEEGLRIDYCESCKGYLKTYDGQGKESVLLADWTSIHLDLIAQDRGLRRSAASLYEL